MSCFSKRGRLPEKITTKFSFQIMRKLPAHIPSPMEEEDDLLFILPCSTEGQESCIMTLKGYFLLLFLVLATGNIFLSLLPMFLSPSWYPESSEMCVLKELLRMDTRVFSYGSKVGPAGGASRADGA